MLGRARARGRARRPETAVPGSAQEPTPQAAAPPAEGQLVGRGRQKGAPGPFTEEAVSQISSGFHAVKLGERGGRHRDIFDTGINTREAMEHVKYSKAGTTGSPITLLANFCTLKSQPQWVLYQYHVDFKPQMESCRLRTALLYQHEETLGSARSFDGAMLFLSRRLHSKVL
ncbi:unnamed protein product [Lampetra planeri]